MRTIARTVIGFALPFACLMSTAALAQRTTYDYRRQADFANIRTFAFRDAAPPGERTARIREALEAYCARHEADEIYRAGQRQGLPWAPIRTQDESLDDRHLHDRGFWVPVQHPELGREFLYAGGPFIMPAAPWRFARRPPLLGEHTAEVLAEVGGGEGERAGLRAARVVGEAGSTR